MKAACAAATQARLPGLNRSPRLPPAILLRGGIIAASGGFAAIAIALSVARAQEARGVANYGPVGRAREVGRAILFGADSFVLMADTSARQARACALFCSDRAASRENEGIFSAR